MTTASATATAIVTTSVSVVSADAAAGVAPPVTRRTADGQVQFESETYRITAGDNDQVVIENKGTGEVYRIWGDPHVEIDGAQAFDFWGQTTFVLDDGTKVTIVTKVVMTSSLWEEGGFGATLATRVIITDGDYGVYILGVDSIRTGDLTFVEYAGAGEALDASVRDGTTLHENADGAGLVIVDAEGQASVVDQAAIDLVDEAKVAQDLLLRWYSAIFSTFGSVNAIVLFGELVQHRNDAWQPDELDAERKPQPTPEARTDTGQPIHLRLVRAP